MREFYEEANLEIVELDSDDSILTSLLVEKDDDWTTNEDGWENNSPGSDQEDEDYTGYH